MSSNDLSMTVLSHCQARIMYLSPSLGLIWASFSLSLCPSIVRSLSDNDYVSQRCHQSVNNSADNISSWWCGRDGGGNKRHSDSEESDSSSYCDVAFWCLRVCISMFARWVAWLTITSCRCTVNAPLSSDTWQYGNPTIAKCRCIYTLVSI